MKKIALAIVTANLKKVRVLSPTCDKMIGVKAFQGSMLFFLPDSNGYKPQAASLIGACFGLSAIDGINAVGIS